VGERVATCWRFEYGDTADDRETAIADVEGLLTDVDAGALEVLSVRPLSG
jgi:hypothetical protein